MTQAGSWGRPLARKRWALHVLLGHLFIDHQREALLWTRESPAESAPCGHVGRAMDSCSLFTVQLHSDEVSGGEAWVWEGPDPVAHVTLLSQGGGGT